MFLLRQWSMLEALLLPTLMAIRPLERVLAWNIGYVDDALAVALSYLHHIQAGPAAPILVFHSGVPPASRPIEWGVGDLRGVPKEPWLETSPGHRGRWRPHRQVLESVVLSPPGELVDLLICGHGGDVNSAALAGVRPGGHLLLAEPGLGQGIPARDWQAVDCTGCLYRRVTAPEGLQAPAPRSDEAVINLARHQDQADLIESYTNLARSLAHRFAHRGERGDDLEQVALLALVKAAGRYDPQRGKAFGPYATASITGELKRHFRDKIWSVRVPRSVQEMHLSIRAAREELTQSNGTSPTIGQIAEYLHTSEEEILTAMEAVTNAWATSLDAHSPDGDSGTTEVPVGEAGFDRVLDRRVLIETIADLSPTERLILKRVFFEGRTQRQVAVELSVSQMQISRLTTKALAKMRESFQPV